MKHVSTQIPADQLDEGCCYLGREIGKQILRGVLGSILGGRR